VDIVETRVTVLRGMGEVIALTGSLIVSHACVRACVSAQFV